MNVAVDWSRLTPAATIFVAANVNSLIYFLVHRRPVRERQGRASRTSAKTRMKIGIARHDGPAIRPIFWSFNQSGANGIREYVETDFGKCASPPLVLAQDMVVRLMLKMMRAQRHAKMFTQKFHAVSLVAIAPQSHPEQMNVIRRETIGRTKETFTGGGVQHHFSKAGVERFIEPADASPGNGHCPMNHGIALIMFTIQARKVEVAVCTLAEK
jgi:hypothetical protein